MLTWFDPVYKGDSQFAKQELLLELRLLAGILTDR